MNTESEYTGVARGFVSDKTSAMHVRVFVVLKFPYHVVPGGDIVALLRGSNPVGARDISCVGLERATPANQRVTFLDEKGQTFVGYTAQAIAQFVETLASTQCKIDTTTHTFITSRLIPQLHQPIFSDDTTFDTIYPPLNVSTHDDDAYACSRQARSSKQSPIAVSFSSPISSPELHYWW